MSFEISRLRGGDRVIAIGAIALFVFMFFFKWFGVEVPAIVSAFVAASHVSTSANAWHTLEAIRWLLFITVLVSIVWVALRGLGRKLDLPILPISPSAIVAGLGALCTLLVLYRVLISHPFPHAQVKIGAWLGLISCAVIAYGGYRAMTDEGTTLADVREQARASFDSVTTAAGGGASTEGEAPIHTETTATPPH
jgi:hypothetical protein